MVSNSAAIIVCVFGVLLAFVGLRGLWHYGIGQSARRRRGREGERKVGSILAGLPDRDCFVFNDLLLPTASGGTVQIDHVAVSRRGVFVVETKSCLGRVWGAEHAQTWEQHVGINTYPFYNPLLQNASHLRALRGLLPGVEASAFVSAVVFTSAWKVTVQAGDYTGRKPWWAFWRIRRTLDPEGERLQWWRPWGCIVADRNVWVMRLGALQRCILKRRRLLETKDVKRIAAVLQQSALTGSSERRAHVARAKAAASAAKRKINAGVCPRCGSPLVRRQGYSGPFLACTRYPGCRFVEAL